MEPRPRFDCIAGRDSCLYRSNLAAGSAEWVSTLSAAEPNLGHGKVPVVTHRERDTYTVVLTEPFRQGLYLETCQSLAVSNEDAGMLPTTPHLSPISHSHAHARAQTHRRLNHYT
ncbi:unnamed protein product [Pleuronectes platessa]|uniref:Uncharacterized protein n=1 Tax=Pleuronectes platessa TaxID=8262 RepID=A0A9N7YCI9_PLEPL|nr:unnamed protein product [Pleuronectes platessa]